MIPYSKQHICEDDIAAVVDVLRSTHLTQGAKVTEFEQAIAHHVEAKHAIATNSGTSALHIACLALGVSRGDYVWTSPISFVASSNCALYCGAHVDFVDVEPHSGNMDMEELARKLAQAKLDNCLPKVIIVVHLCGAPCDLAKLAKLAQQYNFKVIEDACHALGASYENSPIGKCDYSDITVFSFHAVKNLTTAEGGMALTQSAELASTMRLLASHGITKDPERFVEQSVGDWYHEQQLLGFNYRMSDIHAALGLSQLNKFGEMQHQRADAVEYYQASLQGICTWLEANDNSTSANHLFVIQVPKEQRKTLFDKLRENNIWVQLHYMNIASQPYYRELGFNNYDYPIANQASDCGISLPVFADINKAEQDKVINIIKENLCS
ncbi:UDP-4-amino-4,6-dideoxy-N-acetyl-beta-L-altrosamine transaminase [Psychrobium sp. MM17-31]|uniref:UDP-4-amino-4, 6-dideoxy-N-acetyl-beta-L-altrosamine transaminase n=1 Tax=Psychrobium sp. MM17-31 TaxID=2917758 RepID=UPI001EF59CBB|nr:UDP-4-amino-4,6-dideoxy-N-acetyl-beta-L-altrosamine transaminase [Psychrobium sp. MM17-31]MCG7530099.1 UDP-4-amino-4,6-dideoxy-N-acetyl-beta-L-altrosamine transaminase [Psychrobium sp. MM17-31]